jgi:hypothetical protein
VGYTVDRFGRRAMRNVGRLVSQPSSNNVRHSYTLKIFVDMPDTIYGVYNGTVDPDGTWTGLPLGGNTPMWNQAHAQPIEDLRAILPRAEGVIFVDDYKVEDHVDEKTLRTLKGLKIL